jgi:hypothetical protein
VLDPDLIAEEYANEGASLLSVLTPKQLEIESDTSYLRTIWGSRQWGKTTWTGVAHTLAAISGATSLAIAPTVTKARDLLWPACEWLNAECNAGLELRRGDFQIRTPNGGTIQLMGMSTMREAEKIRGYTPPFITIEECGVYHPELLEYAVDGCATPAQVKWFGAGGRGIALIGTPGRNVEDYWHRMCRGELGGSSHWATLFDNPYIPDPAAYLRWILEKNKGKGWTEATPIFRREYRGEFCPETDSLPYGRWDGQIWNNGSIPQGGLTVLSVDFGQVHHTSWVVGRIAPIMVADVSGDMRARAWRLHVIYADQESGCTTDYVSAKVKQLEERFSVGVITGDPYGGGKQSIVDMNKVYNVGIDEEDKRGTKMSRIWMGGSMLGAGTAVLHEDTKPLQHQIRTVPWNDEKNDHDGRYPDHCLDAFLGLVGYMQAWQAKLPPPPPDELSTEGMTIAAIKRKLAAQRGEG